MQYIEHVISFVFSWKSSYCIFFNISISFMSRHMLLFGKTVSDRIFCLVWPSFFSEIAKALRLDWYMCKKRVVYKSRKGPSLQHETPKHQVPLEAGTLWSHLCPIMGFCLDCGQELGTIGVRAIEGDCLVWPSLPASWVEPHLRLHAALVFLKLHVASVFSYNVASVSRSQGSQCKLN